MHAAPFGRARVGGARVAVVAPQRGAGADAASALALGDAGRAAGGAVGGVLCDAGAGTRVEAARAARGGRGACRNSEPLTVNSSDEKSADM